MLVNIKYIAMEKTLNIILRSSKRSPERCARNLLELGSGINNTKGNIGKDTLYPLFLDLCKQNNKDEIKKLFYQSFIE
ncbi:hypothetical protein [Anaeromicropila herbilytica]|uniref:Uncharacterized protein n=1 Tax=Anaeromicropila herbilytica TaxID=2785025 RepID=A0A7R7EH62_9FIRM|nr:hypothetical protein [Anaeromicropila herbilytica]BCN29155.1 hypothetical protein bsdtb5_04500 [Anaeromicropila herbilytica]